MNPIVKNILAVVAGIIIGMVVNMSIVMMSGSIIPLPEGIDPADPESLKANIHLFEARHFIMPLLAHALGTLAGAFVTAKIAANNKLKLALVIGVFFLLGGIANSIMLGTGWTVNLIDWIFAYIPMAWIGWKLGK